MQICYGYPRFIGDPVLMNREGYYYGVCWRVYRLIPFFHEFKLLLDWTCTDTTLWLYDFLKFEEIRASVFLIGCNLDY